MERATIIGTEMRSYVNTDAKGGFRRVEMLTGPGRRRRWSEQEKGRIVAEMLAPGPSVSEVARCWQVCPQQVFGWRREARTGLLVLPGDGTELKAARFVPIVPETASGAVPVTEMVVTTLKGERASKGAATPGIEIKLAGAVVGVTRGRRKLGGDRVPDRDLPIIRNTPAMREFHKSALDTL